LKLVAVGRLLGEQRDQNLLDDAKLIAGGRLGSVLGERSGLG
jgi:hypothetical protein